MTSGEERRALQPPFLGFIQRIVPTDKWDASKSASVSVKQAKFVIVVSVLYAVEGVSFFSSTKMKAMGFGSIVLAFMNVIIALANLCKARKAIN